MVYNMKKRILVTSICILILSALFHSIYKMIPTFLTSIIFPVNESIWEHGKMILLSFIVWTVIEKTIFKDKGNTIYSNFSTAIICIILTYLIFTPIFLYILKAKDNLPVTIIIYFICILVSVFIKEKFIRKENDKTLETIGIIGFLTIYIVFGITTYKPLEKPIFYDYNEKIYGINYKPSN